MRLTIFVLLLSSSILVLGQEYEKRSLSDTLKIDINGDGSLDYAIFTIDECKELKIQSNKDYSFGCGSEEYFDYPSQLEWVDYWGIFPKQVTEESILTPEGDLDSRNIDMQNDGIYLMKEDDGLIIIGVLTFMDGNPYWIHQYC